MKKLFLVLVLFLTTCFYGQKTYSFDYLIEYKYTMNNIAKEETIYVLTNSTENSYHVVATYCNEALLDIFFKDQKQFHSSTVIIKNGFLKAEKIELPCKSVYFYAVKVDLKRFDFMNNTHTLIANQKYKNYSMQYRKAKESKKFKKGKSFYIVENQTEFHKPLLIFSSVFDVSVT